MAIELKNDKFSGRLDDIHVNQYRRNNDIQITIRTWDCATISDRGNYYPLNNPREYQPGERIMNARRRQNSSHPRTYLGKNPREDKFSWANEFSNFKK